MPAEDTDVLIIGSGLSGLYTALLMDSALSITIITKSRMQKSNSDLAQGGIAAAIGKDDSPTLHLRDTLEAGAGLCDPEAVQVLVDEAGDNIDKLIELDPDLSDIDTEIRGQLEKDALYANYIEALQQGPTAPVDPLLANSGAVLAPRVSEQYEIGGKLALGPVFASLAFYRIERPGEGVISDGGQQVFGYVGEAKHEGVEFTLNGEVAPGLRLITGLAINDAEFDTGLEVIGVPDFTFNANAEWDIPFLPGATLTGRVTHTGEQAADSSGTLVLDDWTVVDLGARYVFAADGNPITLRLTVDNVFDEAYWASAFDTFAPAVLQGAPRTVKASLSIAL